jgi:hypothetical protein
MPFSQQQYQERFIPLPVDAVYSALCTIVGLRFKLKQTDDFTKSVTFSSGMSAFTWGENFNAQVVSAQGGSNLRINGVGKVGGQIQQQKRTNKLIEQLFTYLTDALRNQATPGQVTAGRPEVESLGQISEPPSRGRPAAKGADIPEQIRNLAQLRDEGVLTVQEFEAKKGELLSRM